MTTIKPLVSPVSARSLTIGMDDEGEDDNA